MFVAYFCHISRNTWVLWTRVTMKIDTKCHQFSAICWHFETFFWHFETFFWHLDVIVLTSWCHCFDIMMSSCWHVNIRLWRFFDHLYFDVIVLTYWDILLTFLCHWSDILMSLFWHCDVIVLACKYHVMTLFLTTFILMSLFWHFDVLVLAREYHIMTHSWPLGGSMTL